MNSVINENNFTLFKMFIMYHIYNKIEKYAYKKKTKFYNHFIVFRITVIKYTKIYYFYRYLFIRL